MTFLIQTCWACVFPNRRWCPMRKIAFSRHTWRLFVFRHFCWWRWLQRSVQVIVSLQEGSVFNNLYLIIPFYASFSAGLAIRHHRGESAKLSVNGSGGVLSGIWKDKNNEVQQRKHSFEEAVEIMFRQLRLEKLWRLQIEACQWPCGRSECKLACFTDNKIYLKQTKPENKTVFENPQVALCWSGRSRWRALPKTRRDWWQTNRESVWKGYKEFLLNSYNAYSHVDTEIWSSDAKTCGSMGYQRRAVRPSALLTSIAGLWRYKPYDKNREVVPGTKSKWFHAIVRYSLYEAGFIQHLFNKRVNQ